MSRWQPVESAILLATDFDGTISPIVARPEDAEVHPCALRLLQRCSELPSIAVAVLSGRDVDDLRGRLPGVRAIFAGSHGLECIDEAGRPLWTPKSVVPDPDDALVGDLESSGARLERKKCSLAVHTRGCAPRDVSSQLSRFVAWARANDLEIIPGRKVVEARIRGGGKRAALRAIAAHVRARRVVYAGDDLTDFDALTFAAARGRAIFVESSERSAPDVTPLFRVATVEGLCYAFTREIIDWVPRTAVALAHDPNRPGFRGNLTNG